MGRHMYSVPSRGAAVCGIQHGTLYPVRREDRPALEAEGDELARETKSAVTAAAERGGAKED